MPTAKENLITDFEQLCRRARDLHPRLKAAAKDALAKGDSIEARGWGIMEFCCADLYEEAETKGKALEALKREVSGPYAVPVSPYAPAA